MTHPPPFQSCRQFYEYFHVFTTLWGPWDFLLHFSKWVLIGSPACNNLITIGDTQVGMYGNSDSAAIISCVRKSVSKKIRSDFEGFTHSLTMSLVNILLSEIDYLSNPNCGDMIKRIRPRVSIGRNMSYSIQNNI